MIVDGIVEPGRHFDRGVSRIVEDRGIGEANRRIKFREGTRAQVITVIKLDASRRLGKGNLLCCDTRMFLPDNRGYQQCDW